MIRTCIFGIIIALSTAASSFAVAPATLSESFSGATLDSRLSISASSNAYSIGQLTAGSTWQMSKQAGTTTGAVEIQTNFKVSGNFTAELTIDNTNLGTGDFGMRFGEYFFNYPITEMFYQGPQGVNFGTIASYVPGGYSIGGFNTSTHVGTLRVVRSGNQFQYFANGHLASTGTGSSFVGPATVTIFLRPYSGSGAFDPTAGQSDAHSGVLDQFTLTADAFVPEPTSATLILFACVVTWMSTGRARLRRAAAVCN
jgi:hypothetical protein